MDCVSLLDELLVIVNFDGVGFFVICVFWFELSEGVEDDEEFIEEKFF